MLLQQYIWNIYLNKTQAFTLVNFINRPCTVLRTRSYIMHSAFLTQIGSGNMYRLYFSFPNISILPHWGRMFSFSSCSFKISRIFIFMLLVTASLIM